MNPQQQRNRFNLSEWGGAFGDLGTLIPFVVGYISVLGMNPSGMLTAFAVAMIACGLFYRTPIPVQPMKAIGAVALTQAAQTAVITPETVIAASLLTGLLWLLLGAAGVAGYIARRVPPAVVDGIILGLSAGLIWEGLKRGVEQWPLALAGLLGTLLLLRYHRVPAMLVLLILGTWAGWYFYPSVETPLTGIGISLSLPAFVWLDLSLNEVFIGLFFLTLPQVPLTLSNAVIAIRDENNDLFPDRPVTAKRLAITTGLMNLFGSSIGGIPMCHGAGGMAGHVAFGARTGGALLIVGSLLLMLALLCGQSVEQLFGLIPQAVLGVILVITGVQLVKRPRVLAHRGGASMVMVITAIIACWNVGVAFVTGMAAAWLNTRIRSH